jgi:hypothetical protein
MVDRMRQQLEIEVTQALARAAPDFAALDAAANVAAAASGGGTGTGTGGMPEGATAAERPAAPGGCLQRAGTVTARRSAWAASKAAAVFQLVARQLGQAELLQLAPGTSVTQATTVLLLAGALQCAPDLPEAPTSGGPDAGRDAVRWLCNAGRYQAQGLLPAYWEVLAPEDLALAPGEWGMGASGHLGVERAAA